MTETLETTGDAPMRPRLYVCLLFAGILAMLAPGIRASRLLTFLAGYIHFIGWFLFAFHAWGAFPESIRAPKRRGSFLLLIPFVNLVAQYWLIYPLGRVVKREVESEEMADVELGDALPSAFCHLVLVLNVLIQVRIHLTIQHGGVPPLINMVEWAIRVLWLLVATLMFWNISAVLNRLQVDRGVTIAQQSPAAYPEGRADAPSGSAEA